MFEAVAMRPRVPAARPYSSQQLRRYQMRSWCDVRRTAPRGFQSETALELLDRVVDHVLELLDVAQPVQSVLGVDYSVVQLAVVQVGADHSELAIAVGDHGMRKLIALAAVVDSLLDVFHLLR